MTFRLLLIVAVLVVACSDELPAPDSDTTDLTDVDVDANDTSWSDTVDDGRDSDAPTADTPDATTSDVPEDVDVHRNVHESLVDRIVQTGACTNIDDVTLLESPAWRTLRQRCAILCRGDWECYDACLGVTAALTPACASCHASDAECRTGCGDNCLLGCDECWAERCEPELMLCAGVVGPGLDDEPTAPPGAICEQPRIEETLQSVEFAESANDCTASCTNPDCVERCLEATGFVAEECAACLALWHACSQRSCEQPGALPFSAEQLECPEASSCKDNLVACLDAPEVAFAEFSTVAFRVRVSSVVPSLTSLVVAETGRPVLRTLRAGIVTSFFDQLLTTTDFPLGVTAGPVGPGVEVLAEVAQPFEPGRDHTVHIYEAGDSFAAVQVVEPRFSRSEVRVFNGLADVLVVGFEGAEEPLTLASGEVSGPVDALTPLEVVLDESWTVPIPDLGAATALVLWISRNGDGIVSRVTTSRGGFVTPTPIPVP